MICSGCQEEGLQLDRHDDRCRIRAIGTGPEESIVVPLPKSVFCVLLAHLAALGNERKAGPSRRTEGKASRRLASNEQACVGLRSRTHLTSNPSELTRIERAIRQPAVRRAPFRRVRIRLADRTRSSRFDGRSGRESTGPRRLHWSGWVSREVLVAKGAFLDQNECYHLDYTPIGAYEKTPVWASK